MCLTPKKCINCILNLEIINYYINMIELKIIQLLNLTNLQHQLFKKKTFGRFFVLEIE